MEAITLGFALGVGAAFAFKRGRAAIRATIGWSARQAGWVSSRVSAAIEDARGTARREYQRGREANLEVMTELPPPSVREREAPKSVPPPVVTHTKNGNGTAARAS